MNVPGDDVTSRDAGTAPLGVVAPDAGVCRPAHGRGGPPAARTPPQKRSEARKPQSPPPLLIAEVRDTSIPPPTPASERSWCRQPALADAAGGYAPSGAEQLNGASRRAAISASARHSLGYIEGSPCMRQSARHPGPASPLCASMLHIPGRRAVSNPCSN
eukprot:CAMPEP_0172064890 /NCGR_PEP_ID=MMETSP1043-20130122/10344_1 /TAXON_ID=464988 /ORGANISM="Hemiselmis andersenii, Strain CCMP441" /LENGTH=159 /DNA_ID=CAMNT_0012724963 /DNA_START=577 /DNA_END=1058 /DNA_ORIENTATION=-